MVYFEYLKQPFLLPQIRKIWVHLIINWKRVCYIGITEVWLFPAPVFALKNS